MAEHPERFESIVVSEIRGVLDEHGHSPFWDALGHHFFDIDFAEADRLSVINKKFIAELMPRHPIYIPLPPTEAQAVIGKPHQDSVRAARNTCPPTRLAICASAHAQRQPSFEPSPSMTRASCCTRFSFLDN